DPPDMPHRSLANAPCPSRDRTPGLLTSPRLQIQWPVVKHLCPRQRRRDPGLRPAAVTGVKRKLVVDVLPCQRLMGAAAHMGLALLDDAAVAHHGADMAREVVRIGIVRIDDIADLDGKRE